MRTFEVTAPGGAKLEGVVFGDGSIAVRRRDDDPTERFTHTFEGPWECEEELGIRIREPWQVTMDVVGTPQDLRALLLYRGYEREPNEPEPEAP
jgi:hypothetical protein